MATSTTTSDKKFFLLKNPLLDNQCSLFMLSLQVTYDQVIIVSTAKTSIKNGHKSSTNSQLQIQFKFSQRDLKLKS